jgi:nucleoside-diphosphate-sugar epimerase
MKIVITGASGFIGRHLLERLQEKHELAVLEHGVSADAMPVQGAKIFQGDVTKKETLAQACEGAELAIHMAGRFAGTDQELYDVNVQGTANFLDACIDAGVKKVIMFSSAAVYPHRPDEAPGESEMPAPATPYGASKKMAELEVERRVARGKIRSLILRLTNVYGPGGKGVLNKYVEGVAAGTEIVLQGDGSAERDFVYVEDLVDAVEKAIAHAENMPEISNIFNISSNSKITLSGLIVLVEKIVGKSAKVRKEEERPGSVKCLWADNSKARAVLGWEPKITLEEGIRLTAAELGGPVARPRKGSERD